MFIGAESAKAAARRPPPPSPEEKIDPNVSGVTAKVLASKKRKEAMKAEIAKLREKGKVIEWDRSNVLYCLILGVKSWTIVCIERAQQKFKPLQPLHVGYVK